MTTTILSEATTFVEAVQDEDTQLSYKDENNDMASGPSHDKAYVYLSIDMHRLRQQTGYDSVLEMNLAVRKRTVRADCGLFKQEYV